ncbi:hypothetical protein FHS82_002076 [Pseudochelatococcus lubricantis]|uniref:Uncharacterized protein n=1 Tax=Pseudochelatococcus lubricantis TaxID=1538102 RepID=A0ABX0UZ59_9HYPH|nr:hypothetical protein [Pseudochelatococcus lubricantis]NIJ58234.1 hypothetical protein [Pseudochelatococcus lubricantis]
MPDIAPASNIRTTPLLQPMSLQKSGIADADKGISRTAKGNIETGGGKPTLEQRGWAHQLMHEIGNFIARITGTLTPLLALAGLVSFALFPPAAIPLLVAAGGLLLGGLAIGGVTDIIKHAVERREERASDENNALETQARTDYTRRAAFQDSSPDKLTSPALNVRTDDRDFSDHIILIGEDDN